jgi:ribosomal protein L10
MAKLDNIQRAEYLLSTLGNILIEEVQELRKEQKGQVGLLSQREFNRLLDLSTQILGYSRSAKELLTETLAKKLTDEDLEEAAKLLKDTHEKRDS